ncbi:orotate phosphoribosyltransferase [Methylophilaceae bacterium]|nr:orotate phosphoribosyltransferase [Methylophilaceae bacterium]
MLCAAANGGDLAICPECLKDMPWHRQSACPQCGLASSDNHICGHCLKSPPAFDSTHALFRYEYPLDAMLQHYKYRQTLNIAKTFSELMTASFPLDQPFDRIIPMPLHPKRLAERGFNQSVEIARLLSKRLRMPLDSGACTRIKFSPPQASLPLKTRIKNMRGAFHCDATLSGERVMLVDDVMTTGASLHELAATVKSAGASHVECWVVARTLPR